MDKRDSELEEGLNEKKLINLYIDNKNRYDREEGETDLRNIKFVRPYAAYAQMCLLTFMYLDC